MGRLEAPAAGISAPQGGHFRMRANIHWRSNRSAQPKCLLRVHGEPGERAAWSESGEQAAALECGPQTPGAAPRAVKRPARAHTLIAAGPPGAGCAHPEARDRCQGVHTGQKTRTLVHLGLALPSPGQPMVRGNVTAQDSPKTSSTQWPGGV